MNDVAVPPPSASVLRDVLREVSITHVVGLPDNASAPIFELLSRNTHPALLPVTREGESFAIASGMWIGGARPAILIQNTGLLESGDALRGTATRMRVPLLCLITMRGFAKMEAAGDEAKLLPNGWDARTLARPDLDSVAPMTEPTLHAWGVPSARYGSDSDAVVLVEAVRRSEEERRPMAVLLTRGLTS